MTRTPATHGNVLARGTGARLAVILVIVVATLSPGTAASHACGLASWRCSELWGLDIALNLLFFAPWGIVERSRHQRWIKIAVTALCISAAVETLQALPAIARNPSLVDVVTNTCGALLGACAWEWLRRLARRDTRLRSWSVCAAVAFPPFALAVGALAFAPSRHMNARWYGQAPPDLGQFEKAKASAIEATINRVKFPFTLPAHEVAPLTDTLNVRAIISNWGNAKRFAPVATVFDGESREIIVVGEHGTEPAVRSRTRAMDFGFRGVLYAPRIQRCDRSQDPCVGDVRLNVTVAREQWCVSLDTNSAHSIGSECFAVSPAAGWLTLLPTEIAVSSQSCWLGNVCWLFVISFPLVLWCVTAQRGIGAIAGVLVASCAITAVLTSWVGTTVPQSESAMAALLIVTVVTVSRIWQRAVARRTQSAQFP